MYVRNGKIYKNRDEYLDKMADEQSYSMAEYKNGRRKLEKKLKEAEAKEKYEDYYSHNKLF